MVHLSCWLLLTLTASGLLQTSNVSASGIRHGHGRLETETVLYEITVTPSTSDLGVRFSKITFEDRSIDTSRLPFTYRDYPISNDTAKWLSVSKCPSVTTQECPECAGIDFDVLVKEIGGPPTHPDVSASSPYWQELAEVVVRHEQRKNGTDVQSVLPLPDIWQDFDLNDVAEAVNDEYPGVHHQALIESLLKGGAKVDKSVVPQHCSVEFIRGVVMLAHLNTWAIANVGPINFGVKYYVGRARPEEIAYKISKRELSNVPLKLLQMIPENSLPNATSFTAYPKGSPMHPSWPAMHSAASVGSLWLAVVMNLSNEQMCQAQLVDYGVAYARTVAGVHYASDNISGLRLGQKIIADKLPTYLNEMYGSNATAVEEKVQQVLLDWTTFLESDCYVSRMT